MWYVTLVTCDSWVGPNLVRQLGSSRSDRILPTFSPQPLDLRFTCLAATLVNLFEGLAEKLTTNGHDVASGGRSHRASRVYLTSASVLLAHCSPNLPSYSNRTGMIYWSYWIMRSPEVLRRNERRPRICLATFRRSRKCRKM